MQEIQYAKKIRENEIPHMELMRRIFGRQGSKPEAMYSTHVQDAKYAEQNENEQLDKSVPETQDNDGDDSNIIHTTVVHHHSQNHFTRLSSKVTYWSIKAVKQKTNTCCSIRK